MKFVSLNLNDLAAEFKSHPFLMEFDYAVSARGSMLSPDISVDLSKVVSRPDAVISFERGVVEFTTRSSDDPIMFGLDPFVGAVLFELARIEATRGLNVSVRGSIGDLESSVEDLSRELNVYRELAPSCVTAVTEREWVSPESPLRQFAWRAFRHHSDVTFYHASRKSFERSIMRTGLMPALRARDLMATSESRKGRTPIGWTNFNLHLQDAAYLTADIDYARSIARTLAIRYDEPAVIVEVDGATLNSRRLYADEDVFRDQDGMLEFDRCLEELPAYFTSMFYQHLSVAYRGRIKPGDLRVTERMSVEQAEESLG